MSLDDRVLRQLKLSDLRLLHNVVERGGMAKAAARLNISQPAVSKGIAALERTLGVRLLDRTPQGIAPTIYGQALLKWGTAVFDDLRQGVKEIEFLADPTTGELRVGTNAAQMAAAIVERCLKRHPKIVFHITESPTFSLLHRELNERSIDLVLGRLPSGFGDENIDVDVLGDEQTSVVAGLQNPWLRRRKIQLADIIHEPWVVTPPDSMVGDLQAQIFREQGLEPPRGSVVTLSLQVAISLVSSGRFLAMLPASLLRFGGEHLALKVLPVYMAQRPRHVTVVTLKNRTVSPVTKLFIETAREIARPLRPMRQRNPGID